jgi:hypothetical protein
MNQKRWDNLHEKRDAQETFRLNNVKLYPEYALLRNVDRLKRIADTMPHEHRDWLPAATCLIQLSIGTRYIENLVVKFQISDQLQYDPALYIVQTGAAKESSETARKYNKA